MNNKRRTDPQVPCDNIRGNNSGFYIEPVDKTGFRLDKIGVTRHNYHLHPLMQMDQLEALAKRLYPLDKCRFIGEGVTAASTFDHNGKSAIGRSIEETFQRLEEPGSWVALYNIETDPLYKKFTDEIAASVQKVVRNREKQLEFRAYIFISAPPSITPFHIDSENNFWLQIHGRKKINVWDRDNHRILAPAAADHFMMTRGLQEVIFKEEMMPSSLEFDCGPGEGLYFPCTTPHMTRSDTSWVQPGNGITASLAIVYYSDVTRRTTYVHGLNKILRRYVGWEPRPVRQSKWLDSVKYPVSRVAVELYSRLAKFKLPQGFKVIK